MSVDCDMQGCSCALILMSEQCCVESYQAGDV